MQSATLRIGFDVGSSLSKIIYTINDGSPQFLMMEPDVVSLPATSIEHLSGSMARPENQAWVKLDRDSERIHVCGYLAKEFSAVERIEMLKYEYAFYKFLAAVGVIAANEKCDRLNIHVAMLLPYGEITSREQLQAKITSAIKKYYFQNKLVRGRIASFQCHPESTGMVLKILAQHGQDWFSSRRVVVLIFGYRNISCMSFNRGVLEAQHSATSDLGFVNLIDKIIARTPGQNRYALTKAVYAIGSDLRTDHRELQSLIRSKQPENIQTEAKLLVNAIEAARYEYWQLVQDWLNSVVPEIVDHLAVSGGTSAYLKSLLDQNLAWAKPEWMTSPKGALLGPALQMRFADVIALFESIFQVEVAA